MKHRILALSRPLLAIGLLVFLFQRIGLEQLALVLDSLNPGYFVLLFGLLLLDNVCRAFSWRALLGIRNQPIPFRDAVYNYIVGGFFGTFLPSSLGSDASRALLVSRRNQVGVQDSLLAMLVLNLMGLLALCIVGLGGVALAVLLAVDSPITGLMALLCVCYILLFAVMLKGWIPQGWLSVEDSIGSSRRHRVFHRIREFSRALLAFRHHRATMATVLGVFLGNQLMAILTVYTVSLALDIRLSPWLFVIYVPMITLSRLIPFSIAGLGGEQGVFVYLFGQAGVPAAEAFLISLILSVSNLGFCLLGGGLFALDSGSQLWRQTRRPGY